MQTMFFHFGSCESRNCLIAFHGATTQTGLTSIGHYNHAGSLERLKIWAHAETRFDFGTADDTAASPAKRPHAVIGLDEELSFLSRSYSLSMNVTFFLQLIGLGIASFVNYDQHRLRKESVAQLLSDFSICAAVPLFDPVFTAPQATYSLVFVNASVLDTKSGSTDELGRIHTFSVDSTNHPFIGEMANNIVGWAINSTRDIMMKAFLSSQMISTEEVCNQTLVPRNKDRSRGKMKPKTFDRLC